MRHRVGGKQLNRDKDHREALLKNLASSLILSGRIETSVVKAKFLRPFIEKLVTKAKNDTFTSLQILRTKIGNEEAIRKLIKEIAPSMKDRNGGYTRIKNLGKMRKGDSSEVAMIEFVSEKKEA